MGKLAGFDPGTSANQGPKFSSANHLANHHTYCITVWNVYKNGFSGQVRSSAFDTHKCTEHERGYEHAHTAWYGLCESVRPGTELARKPRQGCLLGPKVPDSDRGVETIIFR
jgi:hypothetical protein